MWKVIYRWAVLRTNQSMICLLSIKITHTACKLSCRPVCPSVCFSACLSVYARAWVCNCLRDYVFVHVYPCIYPLLLLPNILRSALSPVNWSENVDFNFIYRFILWQVVSRRARISNEDKWRIDYECNLQYCMYTCL